MTIYNSFVSKADCLIVVFLDKAQSYHYVKDVQAIGACIQNMLLQATALGIGSCWIGEILNRAEDVNSLTGVSDNMELMAVIALGYSSDNIEQPIKKPLNDLLIMYN